MPTFHPVESWQEISDEVLLAGITFLELACAPPTSALKRRIQCELDSGPDWTAAVQSAVEQGVLPVFCHRLLTDFNQALPQELVEAMHTHLQRHRARCSAKTAALLTVLQQLEATNVPAIPFKGPTLAQRAFGGPELRVYMDLDFLIPPQCIDRALECLLDNGYRHQAHLGPAEVKAVRHYGGQYFMFHPQTGICVEPHWLFTPTTMAVDVDYEHLWQKATTTQFQSRQIAVLAPEHEVLMLCIHASKEYWFSLKHVVDLAWFMHSHPELDWYSLLDDARRWGCLRMVLLGLRLCQLLLSFDIPSACRSQVDNDPIVPSLAQQIVKAMRDGQSPMPDPFRIDNYRLALRERWRDKFRFVLRTATTPRTVHYRLVELPRGLRWLYIPVKLGWDYLVIPVWKLVKSGRPGETVPLQHQEGTR